MLVVGGVFSIGLAHMDFPACTVGGYSEQHNLKDFGNMHTNVLRGRRDSNECCGGNEMVSEIVPSAVTEGLTRLENESAATREAHADAQRAARAAEQQLARVTEALLLLARASSTTPKAPEPSPLELDHIPLWQSQTPQSLRSNRTGGEHSITPQSVRSNRTGREHSIDGRRLARGEERKPPAPQTAQLFHKHDHWAEVPRQQVASALEQEIADILHSTTRKGRPHSKTEYSPPPSPPNEMPPRHSSNRSSRKSAPSSRRTASGRDRSGSDRLHDRPDGPVESSNGRHEGRGRQEEPGAGRKMEGDKSRRSSSKDRYQLGSG